MKILKYVGVLALLVVMVWAADSRAFFGFDKYESASADKGMVIIPVADVSDGEAHYYKYDAAGRDVKFFLLKSSDGVIRAAFDACDVCYLEKKAIRRMTNSWCATIAASGSTLRVSTKCRAGAILRRWTE